MSFEIYHGTAGSFTDLPNIYTNLLSLKRSPEFEFLDCAHLACEPDESVREEWLGRSTSSSNILKLVVSSAKSRSSAQGHVTNCFILSKIQNNAQGLQQQEESA